MPQQNQNQFENHGQQVAAEAERVKQAHHNQREENRIETEAKRAAQDRAFAAQAAMIGRFTMEQESFGGGTPPSELWDAETADLCNEFWQFTKNRAGDPDGKLPGSIVLFQPEEPKVGRIRTQAGKLKGMLSEPKVEDPPEPIRGYPIGYTVDARLNAEERFDGGEPEQPNVFLCEDGLLRRVTGPEKIREVLRSRDEPIMALPIDEERIELEPVEISLPIVNKDGTLVFEKITLENLLKGYAANIIRDRPTTLGMANTARNIKEKAEAEKTAAEKAEAERIAKNAEAYVEKELPEAVEDLHKLIIQATIAGKDRLVKTWPVERDEHDPEPTEELAKGRALRDALARHEDFSNRRAFLAPKTGELREGHKDTSDPQGTSITETNHILTLKMVWDPSKIVIT